MYPTRALCARSVWKGPHIVPLPIVRPKPGEPVKPIKTMARAATILPNFIGLKFQVHNGKVYNDVTITEDMVGHKLGEFSPIRELNKHHEWDILTSIAASKTNLMTYPVISPIPTAPKRPSWNSPFELSRLAVFWDSDSKEGLVDGLHSAAAGAIYEGP
ncbi:MAG: hypothetical protein Q9176_003736 [Flavoplaca citrina]